MGTDIIKVIMKLYDCSFECSNRRHKFPQKKTNKNFLKHFLYIVRYKLYLDPLNHCIKFAFYSNRYGYSSAKQLSPFKQYLQ